MKLIMGMAFSIGILVYVIAQYTNTKFLENFKGYQTIANGEIANTKSIEVDGVFQKYLEKIGLVTSIMLEKFPDESQRKRLIDLALANDADLVNVEIYELHAGKPRLFRREVNENHLKSYDLDRAFVVKRLRTEVPFPLMELFSEKDRVHIQNSTLAKGMPLLSVGVPVADAFGVVHYVALVDIRLDRLQKGFAVNGLRTTYLVDSNGRALAHTDEKLALDGANLIESPIVREALSRETFLTRGNRDSFVDPFTGEKMFAAYAKTGYGPIVIVQTPERTALGPATEIWYETFKIALRAFWIGLFLIVLGSSVVTGPLELLREVMLEVAQGNFNVRAHVQTTDEVADLADGFNAMVDGLKERDKVKNILNKFHGSSITDDLMKSDLNLGGSKKEVTVFFSDIRDFTHFSEGHTPEEVVEMLNEYFQIMVGIIVANGGIVDKFVGDAIMAIWGAPKSTGDDPGHAVKASLEMRVALNELNELRARRGHTPIKIGMGVHAGPAISGTIGSTERMEYTVIGDTVNMASRIESSTKAFGADLLISESVAQSVGQKFILELAGAAEVKGKSEAIKMYKVRGYHYADGAQKVVQTPYSDYEAGHAEKVKIA